MSGTSLDGIDLALLRTDGERLLEAGRHGFVAYDDETRKTLRAALDVARDLPTQVLTDLAFWPDVLVAAEALVTQAHIAAVQDFIKPEDALALISFHGQTIAHRPDEAMTLQIGDAQALAAALAVDTVGQFRLNDMKHGGQGAPLAPLYHAALAGPARPQAVLNLGGIANISWLGEGDALLAFDTGPANALIDDWVLDKTGAAYDADGALAASGTVNEAALAALLLHPFFEAAPPKSLDRLAFDCEPVRGLSDADGAATLTAFTAASIARALAQCPAKPMRLILCGGGRHNQTLAKMIAAYGDIGVVDCDVLGWQGDALEAQAFAWLAVRSVKGLALSRPETTGVAEAVSGGILFKGA
jgi:anhydro-N-acetylmuramic acid kinase